MFLPRYEIENLTSKYEKLGTLFKNEQTIREESFISYRDMRFLDLEYRLLDLCRFKLENFIRIENSFKKFFDSDMLEDQLNSKADYVMVENLNKIKVNLSDLAHINGYIENLNERLK